MAIKEEEEEEGEEEEGEGEGEGEEENISFWILSFSARGFARQRKTHKCYWNLHMLVGTQQSSQTHTDAC